MVRNVSKYNIRRKLKSILKWVAIGGSTTALLLTIAAQLPRRSGTQIQACENSPYQVYVTADSLHGDLVFPVNNGAFDWRSVLKLENIGKEKSSNYRYLKFGWGDRDFYINTPSIDKIEFSRLMRTFFIPGNPTTIHIQGYQNLSMGGGYTTKCIGLNKSQYLKVVNYVRQSFRSETPIRIQDGFTTTDGFYEGTGFYSMARTCNNWMADALDKADVTTPLWSGLPGPLMGRLGAAVPPSP
jgi:uncharacterized protein (TIGR02117 family)